MERGILKRVQDDVVTDDEERENWQGSFFVVLTENLWYCVIVFTKE